MAGMVSGNGIGGNSHKLVRAAVDRWTGDLIDLGWRNNLLFLRDLRTGTLSLVGADEEHLALLLAGQSVRASQLFPAPAEQQGAGRRLTEIRRKVRLLAEERGIDAGFVAIDTLAWRVPRGAGRPATTCAPILLRALTIQPKGINGADHILTLAETAELNPVLTFALQRQRGVDTAGLAEAVDAADVSQQLNVAQRLLRERADAARVALEFGTGIMAGAFAYEKLPMVRDLEESIAQLAGHPVTAALAGDPAARHSLQRLDLPAALDLDTVPPEHEHLVIDADPSQHQAIMAVLGGSNLILQGPPGTGKSQTIANLIAGAAAIGRTVLFVAQKRAAIDAVVQNLERRGLADLVLDLHNPKAQRKMVIGQIRSSMEQAGQQMAPQVSEINHRLVDRRSRSRRHSELMRTVRQPCGLSIEQLQQELAAIPAGRDLGVELSSNVLRHLPLDRIRELRDDLEAFVESDGLRLWRRETPWADATAIARDTDLRAARDHLDQATGNALRDTRDRLQRLLAETDLPQPTTVTQWGDALALMTDASTIVATYDTEIFGQELERLRAAVEDSSWRKQAGVRVGLWARWTLRTSLKKRRGNRASWAIIRDELATADRVRTAWAHVAGGRLPRGAVDTTEAVIGYRSLRDHLAAVGAITVMHSLAERPEAEMTETLAALKNDETMLVRLPRLNATRRTFQELGLNELVDRVAIGDLEPVAAGDALWGCWLSSWLRALRFELPDFASFTAAAEDRVVEEFCSADVRHIDLATARVRRAVAERQVRARDRWPEQRQLIRAEVSKKARHKPIRQLVDEAPDLLLATRPCWAMSPLVVSQVLPGRQVFDLVVFDEASQIEPADAIPSIMRGSQVVVAGDNKQLPPTSFFSTTAAAEDDNQDDNQDEGAYESVLDRLNQFIPTLTLTWHYRSHDERLIAFSNREIYDGNLVTFPSTFTSSALRHVVVQTGTDSGGSFMHREADRVVDLVLRHAKDRPQQSLGVITLSLRGVESITSQLREALTDRPDLAEFFDEDREVGQRFFIKNIENVQGDERDAIILSVGGTRTATGAVNHNFGPINQIGGERRLNVAVTRARRSLVVVSSFEHHELREESLTSHGLRFLRDYLRFADQAGRDESPDDVDSLSSIERAIVGRLRDSGLNVRPRYGVAGSKVDIAAGDLATPHRLLIAVEIDGAEYHERVVRERDRLRPAQLERMGWTHQRVWTTEWLRDPDGQMDRLRKALSTAAESMPDDRAEPVAAEPPARPAPLASTSARQLPRPPRAVRGLPIGQHAHSTLVALAAWIDSDGLLRDEEEMIDLMKDELGYQRRGQKIVDALRAAVRSARTTRKA